MKGVAKPLLNTEMKRSLLILAVLITGLVITGRSPRTVKGGVKLGEEFSLSIGQRATISGENLGITFLKVLEDSRCPKNVTCIWAGRATSLVSIVSNNTTDIELTEPGLTDQTSQQDFRDYQIDFHLLPYPEAGEEITTDQYKLLMTISKLK